MIKPPWFDGFMPWELFRFQFDAVAEYDSWTEREKATHPA
jgi:hypothetical protein